MTIKAPVKPRLGRGLSSLIKLPESPVNVDLAPQSDLAPAPQPAGPQVISMDSVHPNPHQPRRHFSDTGLSELAASIKTTGLIQPIVVQGREMRFSPNVDRISGRARF